MDLILALADESPPRRLLGWVGKTNDDPIGEVIGSCREATELFQEWN
jgi:hypothetical protein